MKTIKIFSLIFIITILNGCISRESIIAPNRKIEVRVQPPNLFRNVARVSIINSDIFPHIVLIKLFNTNDPSILVKEISKTVMANEKINFDVLPYPHTKFSSSISWKYYETVGMISNSFDNHFQIPFPSNTKVRVCQSSDGIQTTHRDDEINAIDFCVAEKTPIVAAKDGVVIRVIQNFTEGRLDESLLDKANLISLLHSDGSISSYSHIYPNSATVLLAQNVKQGQQIALVGNVGYSSGPHLHFSVKVGLNQLNTQDGLLKTSPVRFMTKNNEEIKIMSGYTYTTAGILKENKSSNHAIELTKINESNQDKNTQTLKESKDNTKLKTKEKILSKNETNVGTSIEEKLKLITNLRIQRLITEQDYQQKRKQILQGL